MAIGKSQAMRFTARGLTDAFDSTDEFKGASQAMANLTFDNSNPELVIPRAGVTLLYQLAQLGFASPTFISIQKAVGTRIYGMVASALNAGHDQPFCIDTVAGTMIPITGITAGNTPTSPATSGDWTPPTMDFIGAYVIVTHPGFDGTGSNFFGVIDLTNPAIPVWSSKNLATNALTAVPVAVTNFNNRAWFAVANTLPFSDILAPFTRTNASQELTMGDSAPITALSGLPIQTTGSGVLSSLTAFKLSQIWQVTGDRDTVGGNNLAQNFISLNVGTGFPRSIAQSTLGIYFLSASGPYVLDSLGSLRALTQNFNSLDPDIQTPFINAQTPTRWAGAYASSIYRVCGTTIIRDQEVTNDYWFDEHKRRWNGPHSFAYDCASVMNGFFILSSAENAGVLAKSTPVPNLNSVYKDLDSAYSIALQSSTFPKTGDMFTKQVAESQIELGGLPLGATYTITAQDEQGNALDSVTIEVSDPTVPLWGAGLWGPPPVGSGLIWTGGQSRPPRTYPVPWHFPLVFEKMQLLITAAASANIQIGTFYARYQRTGYMTLGPS